MSISDGPNRQGGELRPQMSFRRTRPHRGVQKQQQLAPRPSSLFYAPVIVIYCVYVCVRVCVCVCARARLFHSKCRFHESRPISSLLLRTQFQCVYGPDEKVAVPIICDDRIVADYHQLFTYRTNTRLCIITTTDIIDTLLSYYSRFSHNHIIVYCIQAFSYRYSCTPVARCPLLI